MSAIDLEKQVEAGDSQFNSPVVVGRFDFDIFWWFWPVKGSQMEKVNVFPFYALGGILRSLKYIERDTKTGVVHLFLLAPEKQLRSFINADFIPLPVSKEAASRLLFAMQQAMGDINKIDIEKPFPQTDLTEIQSLIDEFENVLSLEMPKLDIYRVSEKSIYSTSKLIERADSIIPESLREYVSELLINDLHEAGRCLAFEVPTAAAFHTVRAAESVMRLYYGTLTDKEIKPKMRNWGAYIEALNKCGADKKITAFLTHIKDEHRNPIMHPEEVLTIEQALVFFTVATSAIISMLMAIQALKESD